MKELFMRLLWYMTDKTKIYSLNLYKDGTLADMDFEYEGESYNITIRKLNKESY